jgi:predicted transcriptional regulator
MSSKKDGVKKLGWESVRTLKAVMELSNPSAPLVKVSDIGQRLGKNKGTIAKALVLLKNDGYVENPVWGGWCLTPRGKKVLEKLQARLEEVVVSMPGRLSDERRLEKVKELGEFARRVWERKIESGQIEPTESGWRLNIGRGGGVPKSVETGE